MKRIKTDILILGSGGAGLFAALHAHQQNPDLSITVAVKGFGPLLVSMDSHGGSLYTEVNRAARGRREAALVSLGVKRDS